MIDNTDHKAPLDEGIQYIIDLLKDLNKTLGMYKKIYFLLFLLNISAIENDISEEKLLAICLGINDDINKTFLRYEELKNKRKPPMFISCFLTDYRSYNLNLEGAHNLDKNKPMQLNNNDGGLSDNLIDLNFKDNPQNNNNTIPNDIFDIFK